MPDPSTMFGVDLASIRDRLRLLDYFNSVDDVQAGAEAIEGRVPFSPPAAFVNVGDESYAKNRLAAGGHAQRAEVNISVLICIASARADGGLGDEVEQARKVVIAQLVAWQPDGATKPLEVNRWRIRLIDAGLIWGEIQFRTAFDLAVAGARDVGP
jgi:hypothetical protein